MSNPEGGKNQKRKEQKKIIEIPKTSQMDMLECDECGETSLNLFIKSDLSTLAFKCLGCGHVGYAMLDN